MSKKKPGLKTTYAITEVSFSQSADAESSKCSIKKGDDVFLIGGRAGSAFANAYMLEKDAQEAILSKIFDEEDDDTDGEDVDSYYVKKLKPNHRKILHTLRNAKVDFDVLLDYYNSVAGEDDRWFVSRTVLR